MAKKYTLDELLIITAAREIHDGENIILGVGLPTTAGAMAKALHAPSATLMMESGIIDFQPLVPPNHIADANACRGFSYATDLFSAFTMTYRGFVDVCFLGVAQIDKFGNVNTTVVGDYYKPKARLPGAGGAPDFLSYAKRTILTMRGGEFVNKLDYFTSPGYLEGGDSRDQSGLFPKGSGPTMLLTTKGISDSMKNQGDLSGTSSSRRHRGEHPQGCALGTEGGGNRNRNGKAYRRRNRFCSEICTYRSGWQKNDV